jgi:hypothetical protein
MTTTIDYSKLVSDALDHFRDTERDFFTIDEIGEAIERTLGEKFPDGRHNKIREEMLRRWGSGVEPAAIGGQLWKFGYGMPPVSP